MKVLQLIQRPQLRGAEVFACQLASNMVNKGHEAIIVAIFPGEAELPFKGKVFNLNGNRKKRIFDLKAWKVLADIVREENPDIIQANAGDTLKYAVLSKMFFRWKQPIFFRNASTISLYIKSRQSKFYNYLFFKKASKIVSVSETSARDFAALYPNQRKKIVTIPIGIDTVKINISSQLYNSDEPKIVHVGGFSFEKNHSGLLSIFEKVLLKNPLAKLHLIGDGPLRRKTEKLAEEKGIIGKVVFHGYRNDALDMIANAQVLVLPSIIEGLPGVILEAFYCKTPVVAYNVGGIHEIVIPEKTGFLIQAGDEQSFADAVVRTLENEPERHCITENAYHLVSSNYLNAKIADKFLDLYSSMI